MKHTRGNQQPDVCKIYKTKMSLTDNIQKILAPLALVMLAIVLGGTLFVIIPLFAG
jgi:hypothetical protein